MFNSYQFNNKIKKITNDINNKWWNSKGKYLLNIFVFFRNIF